jgi:cytochrome c-type biogenesis protein CcmE
MAPGTTIRVAIHLPNEHYNPLAMTPTRKRRLIVISLILAAVGVAAGHAPANARFRLGGVVLEQSIKRASDSLAVHFIVTDRFKEMPVEYTGILPDLFREGQSIIATGAMADGRFVASEILAKHDESYMPKEVKDAIDKAKQAHADKPGG